MKQGTNIGLDKNFNNVQVGDTIKDSTNTLFVIDAYGMAVAQPAGRKYKLSELKEVEVLKGAPAPITAEPEKTVARTNGDEVRERLADLAKTADAIELNIVPLKIGPAELSAITDAELAAELTRRGYVGSLTLTKTLTIGE